MGNVVHYEIATPLGADMFRVEGAPGTPFEPGTEVSLSFRPEDTIAVPLD